MTQSEIRLYIARLMNKDLRVFTLNKKGQWIYVKYTYLCG